MAKSTLLATIVAAAVTAASAQRTLYMPNTANETGINASPNATAIVPVVGWDLQKPFPGRWDNNADPVKGGWTMHLNITANVTSDPVFKHNSRATRISMELKPPAGLIDPQTGNWTVDKDILDTWRIWTVSWSKNSVPPGGRNNDDGSCAGILSDECIASIKAELAAQRAVVQGNESMSLHGGLTSQCPFRGSSIGDVPLDGNFLLNMTLYSDEPIKDEGEYGNAYDFFGSRPLPFAIIFGHGNDTEDITGQPLEHDHVTVGCVKADTRVGDSTMPSSGARGVEARLSTVSLLSFAAMAAVMLLW